LSLPFGGLFLFGGTMNPIPLVIAFTVKAILDWWLNDN